MRNIVYIVFVMTIAIVGIIQLGCDNSLPSSSASSIQWEWFSSPTNNTINAVHMLAADNIWAVGENGNIIHYDGVDWSLLLTSGFGDMNDVFMVDATQGWAVGAEGFLAQYRDSGWFALETGVKTDFNSIAFADPALGWFVGDEGAIGMFDGSGWQMELSNIEEKGIALNCVGIVAVAGGEGGEGEGGGKAGTIETWAMGDQGTILKREDSKWMEHVSPTTRSINCLYTDGLGVGWAGCDAGVVLRYNEGIWETMWSPT